MASRVEDSAEHNRVQVEMGVESYEVGKVVGIIEQAFEEGRTVAATLGGAYHSYALRITIDDGPKNAVSGGVAGAQVIGSASGEGGIDSSLYCPAGRIGRGC